MGRQRLIKINKSLLFVAAGVCVVITITIASWVASVQFATVARTRSVEMVDIHYVQRMRVQEIEARLTALETKLVLLQERLDQMLGVYNP